MKALVYGGSAIENIIAEILSESSLIDTLYLSKPNPAFKHLGKELLADGYELIKESVHLGVDFVISNSGANEEGIVDAFLYNNIKAIGVPKKFAELESSKVKGIEFMKKYDIPMPKSIVITNQDELGKCIETLGLPLVLKPDGHTKGIGVEIVYTKEEANKVLEAFLEGKFYEGSKTVIAQEYIEGEEYSLLSFFDGNELISLPCVKDYKKRLDNNNGPNTGGMGSVLTPNLPPSKQTQIEKYSLKLKEALLKENADFSGCIYSGLIFDKSENLYVLEYNMRIGNSEGLNIISFYKETFDKILINWKDKNLNPKDFSLSQQQNICVNVVPKGYPTKKEKICCNLEKAKSTAEKYNCKIYFNNSYLDNEQICAEDDRLMSICSTKKNADNLYKCLNELEISNGDFRTDIGKNI